MGSLSLQADLTTQDLKGQLQREKARGRTLAARLTTAEANLDSLTEEKAVAAQQLSQARRAVGLPASDEGPAAQRAGEGAEPGWDGLVSRTARLLQGGLSVAGAPATQRHSIA